MFLVHCLEFCFLCLVCCDSVQPWVYARDAHDLLLHARAPSFAYWWLPQSHRPRDDLSLGKNVLWQGHEWLLEVCGSCSLKLVTKRCAVLHRKPPCNSFWLFADDHSVYGRCQLVCKHCEEGYANWKQKPFAFKLKVLGSAVSFYFYFEVSSLCRTVSSFTAGG